LFTARSATAGVTPVIAVLQLSSSFVSSIRWFGSTHASLSSWPPFAVMNTWIVIVTSLPASRSPWQVTLLTGFSSTWQMKLPVASTLPIGIRPTGNGSTISTP
jgi:hypothetical protein